MTSRGDTTRRQILDAAEQEFLAHGYGGTRVEAVAATAYVSVGTIYAHFQNKEGLYAAVLVRAQDVLLDRYLLPVFALDLPPWERIRAWGRAYLRFTLEDTGRARLMAGLEWWEVARPAAVDERLRERIRVSNDRLLAVFEEAEAAGALQGVSAASAGRFFWSALYGMAALNLRHHDISLEPHALDALVDDGVRLLSGGRLSADPQIDA